MKKLLVLVLLCGLLCGCGGIIASAQYAEKIDRTAVWSQQVADNAVAGTLSEAQKTEALKISASHWQDIKNAKDGVK